MHTCAHDSEEEPEIRELASKTWHAMKRTAKAGQRRTLPDMQVGTPPGGMGTTARSLPAAPPSSRQRRVRSSVHASHVRRCPPHPARAAARPRRRPQEIDALFKGVKQNCVVYFLDETFEELAYDASTTVMEAVEALAGQIKLENYQTFSLFAVQKVGGGCTPQGGAICGFLLYVGPAGVLL